ncbi:MAG: TlyA family RNA methyltransferase [Puniceicoccales bacterium]|jgi:23S rRNA (cytidine1920-2'-O)/16S rRNA (cytidine1409-2'-O)-methyltransferase|nr:TlyA family RNA methyltransferase [Puniceicoccales bacterium]
MKKERADELLVGHGIAESRSAAQRLILAGQVLLEGGAAVDKPAQPFPVDTVFRLKEKPRYVGRGGEKLEGFFRAYGEDLRGRRALDIGASTGGFTDYLLQHGAATVTGVDVGHGQLHYRLRMDPRVRCLEGINARRLTEFLPIGEPFNPVVMDLSFISLKKILPEAWRLLADGGLLVALVKPQFEATRAEVSRGKGVIADGAVHGRIRSEIRDFAIEQLPNAQIVAELPSPVVGADGNREFFLGLRKGCQLA